MYITYIIAIRKIATTKNFHAGYAYLSLIDGGVF